MKTNQSAGSFFLSKKIIFVLDKRIFSDKIVSFIHLGGVYEMSDLFVQKSDHSLSLCNQMIVIKNGQREIVKEISIHLVENVVVFGNAQLTTQLLKSLALKQINVYYFSGEGKFLACLDSYRQEDFDKQALQAKACFDKNFCLSISQKIATAKVKHQLALLKNYNQDGLLSPEDFSRFYETLEKISGSKSISEIMGYEGRIAKSYFYYLGLLVPDEFRFNGRSRRPAQDCFNSLLNFGYSLLYSCFLGLIRKNGLSYGFGVMHQSHQHHASLDSDLMEEWRPIIVDNTILDLIFSGELSVSHFEKSQEGAYYLDQEGRRIFIQAMRERMLEIHQYVEVDKKRYTFFYMADLQIKGLIRAFESLKPELYVTGYTGE